MNAQLPPKNISRFRCYFGPQGFCIGYCGVDEFGQDVQGFAPGASSDIVYSREVHLSNGFSPIGRTPKQLQDIEGELE